MSVLHEILMVCTIQKDMSGLQILEFFHMDMNL